MNYPNSVGAEDPKSVILDSVATVSVAPKSFYTKIPLGKVCNDEYKLQNASGGDL